MISIDDIRQKSMNSKKEILDNECFLSRFYRPVSFYLTWPFLNLGISANIVSILSILLAILGMVIAVFVNNVGGYYIAVSVFIFWNFFDCIDGNIARFTNMSTTNGVLWDALGGYFALSLYFITIGVVGYKIEGCYLYIIAGSLTSLYALISRLIMHKYMLLNKEENSEFQNSGNFNKLFYIAFQFTSIDGFMIPLALFFLYISLFNVYIIAYFFIYMTMLVFVISKYLKI